MPNNLPEIPPATANLRAKHIAWKTGLYLTPFVYAAVLALWGASLSKTVVIIAAIFAVGLYLVAGLLHIRDIGGFAWLGKNFQDHPAPYVSAAVLLICVILGTGVYVAVRPPLRQAVSNKNPPPPARHPNDVATLAPTEQPKSVTPPVDITPKHPKILQIAPVPWGSLQTHPSQSPAAPKMIVGTDSVAYGNLPDGTKVGDRSVVVGPTMGTNTIIPAGTAVGYNAHADPTSVAIGAGAGAGNTQSSGTADCRNNAGNCAGVNNGTQITNLSPQPRELTAEQISNLGDAIARIPAGVSVKIGAADSGEAHDYADQIRKALGITREVGIFMSGHFKGIHVTVTSFSDSAVTPAQKLAEAMQKAGFPIEGVEQDAMHNHPGEIGIYVGEQ